MGMNKAMPQIYMLSILAIAIYLQLLCVNGRHLHTNSPHKFTLKNEKTYDTNDTIHLPLIGYYMGFYYLPVSIGTPPQRSLMQIDTGSGNPWVPCSNSRSSNKKLHSFYPPSSSTYQPILCNSSLCYPYKSSWLTCHIESPIPCNMSISYADGEFVEGIFSQDVFSLSYYGVEAINTNLDFGCIFEDDNLYKTPGYPNAGIIGLNPMIGSTLDQMKSQYGRYPIISHCLGSHSYDTGASSWMSIGIQSSKHLSFTPLVGQMYTYFLVSLKRITIDNVHIDASNITTPAYNDAISEFGGYILDTGSPGTFLVEPLHSRFVDTFVAAMKKVADVSPDSSSNKYKQCYAFGENVDVMSIKVPRVTLHLENDVHLELGIENIFYNHLEGNQRLLCSAFIDFADTSEVAPILGTSVFQNFHVEIDYERKQVGFSRTKC